MTVSICGRFVIEIIYHSKALSSKGLNAVFGVGIDDRDKVLLELLFGDK